MTLSGGEQAVGGELQRLAAVGGKKKENRMSNTHKVSSTKARKSRGGNLGVSQEEKKRHATRVHQECLRGGGGGSHERGGKK